MFCPLLTKHAFSGLTNVSLKVWTKNVFHIFFIKLYFGQKNAARSELHPTGTSKEADFFCVQLIIGYVLSGFVRRLEAFQFRRIKLSELTAPLARIESKICVAPVWPECDYSSKLNLSVFSFAFSRGPTWNTSLLYYCTLNVRCHTSVIIVRFFFPKTPFTNCLDKQCILS